MTSNVRAFLGQIRIENAFLHALLGLVRQQEVRRLSHGQKWVWLRLFCLFRKLGIRVLDELQRFRVQVLRVVQRDLDRFLVLRACGRGLQRSACWVLVVELRLVWVLHRDELGQVVRLVL